MSAKKEKEIKPHSEKPRQACPKCGEGTYLAEHKDRAHCGRCGYTRWKK